MKRSCLSIAVAVSAVFVLAAVASAQSVTILGGGLKGQPYQFAVGLSKILKSKAGISATPQSAKGMVAQARIIAKGQAQFAWGLGGPVGAWAYKGERRFKKEGPKKNLRAVLGYPFGQFQWLTLADSGVMSVKDFKGKKVSVGSAASTTQTYARYFIPRAWLEERPVQREHARFPGRIRPVEKRQCRRPPHDGHGADGPGAGIGRAQENPPGGHGRGGREARGGHLRPRPHGDHHRAGHVREKTR